MTRINIELPLSVHERAKLLAKRDGVSVDQFISTALAEKMSVPRSRNLFPPGRQTRHPRSLRPRHGQSPRPQTPPRR